MSGPEIIDVEQNSPEWLKIRLGLPTASEFQVVLSPRAGKEGLGRQTYLRKLAGEIITGEPAESFTNGAMDRGHAVEDRLRSDYAMIYDVEPIRVGFIRNGAKGCSPDSLIGADGGLEVKSMAPHLLIEVLEKDEVPPKFRAQVQGSIWIAEREWWDVAIGYPNMPMFIKRVWRDDGYIANLAGAVEAFNAELAALIERIRRYGKSESIAA
jgi:hypothetical protein